MTSREFLKSYRGDPRILTGTFFSSDPIDVLPGDRVGVVLLSLGGPSGRSDVEKFLYRRWMDPVLEHAWIRGGRHYLVKIASKIGARFLWKDYEQIGGDCPINRLTREQASALQECLNERFSSSVGVTFRTYIAMRYGNPASEHALESMRKDGITKVVLLPLYPQYSVATTGSSLAYWSTMMSRGGANDVPTTGVLEYATHPGYIEAIRDRIDQALQRFPKRFRMDAQIVFSAEQPALGGRVNGDESFCCHVRETVNEVMREGRLNEFHITFFDADRGTPDACHPETRETIRKLADEGSNAVLVVPLGLATDHLWTAYTLDIDLRRDLSDTAIQYFEVATGLNCHPLFIRGLSNIVAEHVVEIDAVSARVAQDKSQRTQVEDRQLQRGPLACPSCKAPVRTRNWGPGATDRSITASQ